MKLQLIKTIKSPDTGKDQAIWVSNLDNAFYLTDRWKVMRIEATGDFKIKTISEIANLEEAYQMKGMYDKRLTDDLFDEIRAQGISGFQLLTKKDYDHIDSPAGSASSLEMMNRFGPIDRNVPLLAHHEDIVTFGSKSISLGKMDGDTLKNIAAVKTKGKSPIHAHLHPTLNLIVYGTNYGEIYGQYFDENGFSKTVKIDNLQNPCYQIGFAKDGDYLIVCGMGYVKLYAWEAGVYYGISLIQTSAKSFEVFGEYLIINKGMHGIDLFKLGDKPEKTNALEVPFAINRLVCHHHSQVLLLTSNPHGQMAFVDLAE